MSTTKKTLDELIAEPLSEERLQELQAIKDEDIDTSDIPELGDDFWEGAEVRLPATKEALSLRVDQDVVDWFRSQGRGYQTKMNAVLRTFYEAHK